MTIIKGIKPENIIIDNCYIDSSYTDDLQPTSLRIDKDSNNIEHLKTTFRVIANDGYNIDYKNCSFSFDGRVLTESDTENYELPTEENIITIDFKDFETVEKIGEYDKNLDIDISILFKNVDRENFKTIKKTIGNHTFFINMLQKTEKSCLIDVNATLGDYYTEKYSVPDYDIKSFSFKQTFEDAWGEYDHSIFRVLSVNFNTYSTSTDPEQPENPISRNIFTTYVVDPAVLSEIVGKQEVYNEIIINTATYPIKFNSKDLDDTLIKLGGSETSIKAKGFTKNIVSVEIFKFIVHNFKDVESCTINLPFNSQLIIDWDSIKNKIITGTIHYEVLTGTTTLIIDNGDFNIYKSIFNIKSKLPFKPTGEIANFRESETRLISETPKLIIKCNKVITQDKIIKGIVKSQIKGILKSELDLLNSITEKGILINE